MHHAGDVFIHATVHQHLFKGATAADDQQHHGNDFDRVSDGAHHLIHAAATVKAKGEDGNQHRNQRRHDRIAKKFRIRQQHMAFRQQHFCHGTQRHQDHRHQRRPHANAKTRHLRFAESFGFHSPSGIGLSMPFRKRAYTGPARITVGIPSSVPYSR
ncbi:hypothetical protein COLO4_00758, partial [Corchorus olitorius]